MINVIPPTLVLSLYPTTRGYAFVLFENANTPHDWGIKEIRKKNKNEATLESVRTLIERYRPDHLIIEDYAESGSHRSSRIKQLYRMITKIAEKEVIEVIRISRDTVSAYFAPSEAKTKYEIAKVVAERVPELAHRLPPMRKIWMSEDPRQGLFDAAALGMVFYAGKDQGK